MRLAAPPDRVVAATGVTIAGALLRLVVTKPPPARPRGRTNQQHEAAVRAHEASGSETALLIAGGSGLEMISLEAAIPSFPYVDLLPNGHILVVGARCKYSGSSGPERNARVFHGEEAYRFHLNDLPLG
jgi:hypothetical protein